MIFVAAAVILASPQETATVTAVLDRFRSAEVDFHGLQTRQSGRHRFVDVHVLVPGAWTVFRGHDLLEQIESAIQAALPDTTVQTHLEPREDPRAYADFAYDSHPPQSRPDNRHTDRNDGGRRSAAIIDVHRGLRGL